MPNLFTDIFNTSTSAIESSSSRHDLNDSTANISIERDDDCIVMPQIVPRPLDSTFEGLIKQNDDTISNDMPFITTVCKIRF